MPFTFPDAYGQNCYLVPIDAALVPLVAGALKLFEQRSIWESEEDYQAGYNAFAELQVCMTGRCIADLVEAQERTYRLLDRALNGTAYVATPDPIDPLMNPPTITPAIPDVPPTTALSPGLLARFERHLRLLDNLSTGRNYFLDAQNPGEPDLDNLVGLRETVTAMQGILNAGWFGIGGQPATLADVVRALRIGGGTQKDSVLATISQILGSGGSTAVIFNAVQDLFGDTVDLAADGAMIGVLIASSMAAAATSGFQTAAIDALNVKLDKLLLAVRGAADPTDNILLAMRGDVPATAERNLAAFVDELEPILIAIGEQLT